MQSLGIHIIFSYEQRDRLAFEQQGRPTVS